MRRTLFEGRRIRSRGPAVSKGFVRFVEGLDAVLKEANRAGRVRVEVAPTAIRSLLMGACEGLLRDRQLAADATYPVAYSRKDISRAIDALIATFLTDPTSPPPPRRSSSR